MERFGYKGGILTGLLLFALGAFLFFPAAETRSFIFFLTALFIIACGLTFLETAANPYITVLGDPDKATQRINFAQSFNGLAAMIAPLAGRNFILSGINLTEQEEAAMSPQQMNEYLTMEASAVKIPFIVIGLVVLTVAIFLWRTKLPDIVEKVDHKHAGSIWKEKNLVLGVIAQFFYVGAQVCVSSFFIRFSFQVAGVEEKAAAFLLFIALLGFMVGRFVGTFLLNYISAPRLLAIYSFANIVLLIAAVMLDGMFSIYALVGVEFFMSIMFPTIFSLSISGLGAQNQGRGLTCYHVYCWRSSVSGDHGTGFGCVQYAIGIPCPGRMFYCDPLLRTEKWECQRSGASNPFFPLTIEPDLSSVEGSVPSIQYAMCI